MSSIKIDVFFTLVNSKRSMGDYGINKKLQEFIKTFCFHFFNIWTVQLEVRRRWKFIELNCPKTRYYL